MKTNFYLEEFLQSLTPCAFAIATLEILAPIIPFCLLLMFQLRRLQLTIPILYMICFVLGRLMLNVLVYEDVHGTSWSNALIAPTVMIALLTYLAMISGGLNRSLFSWACAPLIILSLYLCYFASFQTKTIFRISEFLNQTLGPKFNPEEMKQIRNMTEPPDRLGFVVVEEYLMLPFMERSHVTVQWLERLQSIEVRKSIVKNADYVIVRPNNPLSNQVIQEFKNFKIIHQSTNILCFKRE